MYNMYVRVCRMGKHVSEYDITVRHFSFKIPNSYSRFTGKTGFQWYNRYIIAVRSKQLYSLYIIFTFNKYFCGGQSWSRGTKCDCKIDWL